MGYGVTPYVIDYQRFTKTVLNLPGPSIFPTFLHIYTRKSAGYVECFHFFEKKTNLLILFFTDKKRTTLDNNNVTKKY